MRASIPALAAAIKELQLKLFLSNKYAYAQIVRASDGNVLAAASTIEKVAQEGLGSGASRSLADRAACSRWEVSGTP